MSDTELSVALSRIAKMEAELSGYRGKPTAEQAMEEQRIAFMRDPIGFSAKMGAPVDHITKVFVAHALGDKAPPELKMLAAQGPQMSATSELQSEVKAMRQRLEAFEAKEAGNSTRESLKTLTSDKSKYRHLSVAIEANPTLFDGDVASHKGTATELADALEERLAKYAGALGVTAQTASVENAGAVNQSQQVQPAPIAGSLSGVPPIKSFAQGGPLDEGGLKALKDEIVNKYTPKS